MGNFFKVGYRYSLPVKFNKQVDQHGIVNSLNPQAWGSGTLLSNYSCEYSTVRTAIDAGCVSNGILLVKRSSMIDHSNDAGFDFRTFFQ